MITPVEIQNRTFKSGGLGYDKKDVDSFVREVLHSYEQLYRENMEMTDKLAVLNEGIQYYKSIEKSLQKALVLAEKTADETKALAEQNARLIEHDARAKYNEVLADAKNELESIHKKTVLMLQQYETYKAQFKSLAAAQIELLSTDSFQINVANLDCFLAQEEVAPTKITKTPKNEKPHSLSEEFWSNPLLSSEEDNEIKNETTEDTENSQDEFDFINLEEDES